MNYSYSNIEISEKNNLNNNVDLFIKKISEMCLNTNFNHFLSLSNKLIDSLIDICIKNKIEYFINNHISFSSIKSNFKLELENSLVKYVKKIYPHIDSNITDINLETLQNTSPTDYWNNIVDILSKKSSIKNKVTFNPTATEYTYVTEEHKNNKSKKKSKAIKIVLFENENHTEITLDQKISIYFKIIFSNNIDIDSINDKLCFMCSILNDSNIEYDIYNPYKLTDKKL